MTSFLMAIVRALRFIVIVLIIGLGAIPLLVLSLFPLRTKRGAHLAAYVAVGMARAFVWVVNMRLRTSNAQAIREHEGLLLANHLSFIDIVILISHAPMRFLSTAGVRNLPVIGQMAVALDTIFVKRGKKESRTEARQELVKQLEAQRYPPLVLFPEGVIGPGDEVQEFRHGAFEIAIQTQTRCLPCAIVYNPLAPVHFFDWSDTLPGIVWQIVTHPGRIDVMVTPLPVLDPLEYTDAVQMAEETHRSISSEYRKAFS
ncbi:MAG: 1-acyl-sn-glycerol-3-phosphate acyltransferase [Chloroflexota bacterium]